MPSQDNDAISTADKTSSSEASTTEKDLFEAITKKDTEQVLQIIRINTKLNLNCVDKDELSPLQHACHIGDVEIARILINNGANVNFTKRKDGYTPLMFAAISGKADIIRLLLERGVDITAENCVNRTASQMAAFVGQSKIVSVITNWIPYSKYIEPYTRTRELEDEPRIPSRKLSHILHEYIVYPSYHPVKLISQIKQNPELIEYGSQFIYVLEDLCSKSIKHPANDESLSLKFHYLTYLLQYCHKFYETRAKASQVCSNLFDLATFNKSMEVIIRRLIRRNNPRDIQPLTHQVDRLITECLYKYPYTQLAIYKTSTFALGKSEGGDLNAYSVLTQSLNGPRMFGQSSEACSICLDVNKNKKCSRCKVVYYCGPICQQLDWFQHKKVCVSPEEIPLLADQQPDDD